METLFKNVLTCTRGALSSPDGVIDDKNLEYKFSRHSPIKYFLNDEIKNFKKILGIICTKYVQLTKPALKGGLNLSIW